MRKTVWWTTFKTSGSAIEVMMKKLLILSMIFGVASGAQIYATNGTLRCYCERGPMQTYSNYTDPITRNVLEYRTERCVELCGGPVFKPEVR